MITPLVKSLSLRAAIECPPRGNAHYIHINVCFVKAQGSGYAKPVQNCEDTRLAFTFLVGESGPDAWHGGAREPLRLRSQ